MISKLRIILGYLKNFKQSRLLLAMSNHGYFVETGWFKSVQSGMPVDKDGNPIPWTTYSFIEFIKTYLKPDMNLFEYGSGNSSFFYSSRVQELTCIEHDEKWYAYMKEKLPENCTIIFKELTYGGAYCKTISEQNRPYNVIIIDGRDRVNCMIEASDKIVDNGIIVLDDSERDYYSEGIEFLKNQGFKQLDFWGCAPKYFHNKCTTVFFKPPLMI